MRERESGKIVGFCFGHALGSATIPDRVFLREVFRKYPLFWDFLRVTLPISFRYLLWTGFPASVQNRTARCAAGGTIAGYEGLGLGMRLRIRFVELARSQGYDRVEVETISPATRHIWTKLGFKIVGSKAWGDRKTKDGSSPFQGIEGGFTIHELILRKRPLLDSTWLLLPIVSAVGLCVLMRLGPWLRRK